MFVSNNPGLSR